ncbi:sensor histidine kinase [Clostridium gasigenes]|uniref:sensor histidine kinase n=1 Tax=Clostridium gasigenes TaxID=94869 RepID=UPI001628802C|nr:sensor histidine kinase [Clostridium gasigenes]MBB6625276.1 sensor histidine kinase [Clostridium gasigenes]MBU3089894.1 sensor histidine kinase [Clostridium gasigenes]
MVSKITEDKYIVFLKYILIIVLLYFVIMDNTLDIIKVSAVLGYIINNQLRYFVIKNNKLLIGISYIFELIISLVIYRFSGEYGFIIFMPTLIDITTSINKILGMGYFIVIFISTIILKENNGDILNLVIANLPIIFLGGIVREESEGKKKAQSLYDKLRINEEELKKANMELQNYANTIEEISVLRERNRISREIHDNVGHALTTVIIQLGAIEKIANKDGEMASKMANNLGAFTKESLESVRSAVRTMKPREFEEYEGVIAISEMIKNFEKLSGVKVKFIVSDKLWKLNSDQTMVLYRVIQEFLSNAIRHGKATAVKIFLNFLEDTLRVHLKDNGIGCNNIVEGIGLKSIKERVGVWGGTIEYYSQDNNGFEVIVTMDKGKLSIDGVYIDLTL